MHPDDPDSVTSERLREHGEGMLLLATAEDDIAAAHAQLVEGGARFTAHESVINGGDGRLMVCPKSGTGVVVEVLSTRQ